jgi:hypothetical protein
LELPATATSGFCLAGIFYFFLLTRPPAHWRASTHFLSKISRLRCARDLGSGSTPCASGLTAASFTHSSAFSFPGTPLCAGHHWISMVMFGWAFRSLAMCFHARLVYICLGSGSSDAIRRIAAWVLVKMVILSGTYDVSLLSPGFGPVQHTRRHRLLGFFPHGS